jgi:hypothetical protein
MTNGSSWSPTETRTRTNKNKADAERQIRAEGLHTAQEAKTGGAAHRCSREGERTTALSTGACLGRVAGGADNSLRPKASTYRSG